MRRPPRLLCSEALELRQVLAGNVTAAFTGNFTLLTLTGDDADNDITVTQVANNQLKVVGNNGTLIKHGTDPGVAELTFTFTPDAQGAVKKLKVDLKNGDNRVTIGDGVTTVDLRKLDQFKAGAHVDTMILNKVKVGGNVTIDAGKNFAANNTVQVLGSEIVGNLKIYTGGGNANVTVNGGTNIKGNLLIDAGFGANNVSVQDVTVQGSGTNKINAGKDFQNDVVNVNVSNLSSAGGLKVTTGGGNDVVNLSSSTVKILDVNTMGGADTVTLTSVTSYHQSQNTFELGTDKQIDVDTLTINGGLICGIVTVDTGAGDDVVTVQKGSAPSSAKLLDSLYIDTAKGNDKVFLRNSTEIGSPDDPQFNKRARGLLNVSMGDGADEFDANTISALNAKGQNSVDMGSDDSSANKITLGLADIKGFLSLALGGGTNTATIGGVTTANGLLILGGNGNDTVTIGLLATSALAATLANGNNTFIATGVQGLNGGRANVGLYFGFGEDTVVLDTILCGNFNVSLDKSLTVSNVGKNTLVAQNINSSTAGVLKGCMAVDTISCTNSTFKDLSIELAGADDLLSVNAAVAVTGKLSIDFGAGSDSFGANGFVLPGGAVVKNGPEMLV